MTTVGSPCRTVHEQLLIMVNYAPCCPACTYLQPGLSDQKQRLHNGQQNGLSVGEGSLKIVAKKTKKQTTTVTSFRDLGETELSFPVSSAAHSPDRQT